MTYYPTPARRQFLTELNRTYVACHVCDALWLRPQLAQADRAMCKRCGAILLNIKWRSAQRTVALTLAGLILFIVAVTMPFLQIERAGLANKISMVDAIHVLWLNEMFVLSVASAFFVILFPLLQLLVFFAFGLLQLLQSPLQYFHALTLRFTYRIEPWSMAEIFMIGVIVSLVKIGELAAVTPGPAFWAMASLVVILLMTTSVHSRDILWQQIRHSQ